MTRIKITKTRLLEATIGKMLESYLDEALPPNMTPAEHIAYLGDLLKHETNPARIQKLSAAIQRGNQQIAGGVPQQSPQLLKQSSYGESYIRDLVGEIVEDTMLKRTRAGESQANVPVRVPMPRNPIVSPPGGGPSMGPKELMGILNGIEQMQSLEDLSPADKMALAQAKELMAGVFKDLSSGSGSGKLRQEEAPPDPEIEKWIVKNKKRFTDEYGQDKGEKILYATAWKKHNNKGK